MLFAYKAADTNRTSTTSVTADPDLSIALAANTRYVLRGCAHANANTTPDLNWRWRYTGTLLTAAGLLTYHTQQGVIATVPLNAGDHMPIGPGFLTAGAVIFNNTTNTTTHRALIAFEAAIETNSSGNIELQWGPNASSGLACIVRAGSWLLADEA